MLKVCCSEEKKSRLKNIETAPTYFLISRKKMINHYLIREIENVLDMLKAHFFPNRIFVDQKLP